MGIEVIVADRHNGDFILLTGLLDKDLYERYGEQQQQYTQHNQLAPIVDVVIVYKDGLPVACGAFKKHRTDTAEIKRVFVKAEYRRQGLSKLVIDKLEERIKGAGFTYAVLETGIKQPEAIELYKKCGYEITENYEPYIGNENSVCMRKVL